ncbi:hypothetical protein GCM10025298_10230 [Natronobiforma cellulositropha]
MEKWGRILGDGGRSLVCNATCALYVGWHVFSPVAYGVKVINNYSCLFGTSVTCHWYTSL